MSTSNNEEKDRVQKTIYLDKNLHRKIAREAGALGLPFNSYVVQILRTRKIKIEVVSST